MTVLPLQFSSGQSLPAIRVEQKFILNSIQGEVLRQRLGIFSSDAPRMTEGTAYPVITVYYDFPGHILFYDKINGEYVHLKIRLRKYSRSLRDEHPVFIEIKYKENHSQQKFRWRIETSCNWETLVPACEYLRQVLSVLPVELPDFRLLEPVCNVYFEREAYDLSEEMNSLRLTMDRKICPLTVGEYELGEFDLADRDILRGNCILEIKSAVEELPSWLKRELYLIGARQVSFSKYAAACLALLERKCLKEVSLEH